MIWIILLPVWFTVSFVGGFFLGVLNDRFGILSSKWRFPVYALSSLLAFLILFGDELVGKWQLEKLCNRDGSDQLVSEMARKVHNKVLIKNIKDLPDVPDTAVSIEHYQNIYQDSVSNEVYFIEDAYIKRPGWVKRLLHKSGFVEDGLYPIINSRNCPNKLSSYSGHYQFEIKDIKFLSK